MNMQNIPSHVTDIRHMFRATPELIEPVECSELEDNVVTLEVASVDSIETPQGYKLATSLDAHDFVCIRNANKDTTAEIIAISSDKGKVTLKFKV